MVEILIVCIKPWRSNFLSSTIKLFVAIESWSNFRKKIQGFLTQTKLFFYQ